MSDYISKSALKKYLRDYKWEFVLGSDFSKAIEMVDVQPTVDEKEIIRKPMERIMERLEDGATEHAINGQQYGEGGWDTHANAEYEKRDLYYKAIEIVKEEGGIDGTSSM